MRATFSVSSFLALIWFGCSAAAASVSPFDGVWKREWSSTTPRGLHQVGRWESSATLRLHITYNNVPVLVVIDITKPNSPTIRVLSFNKT